MTYPTHHMHPDAMDAFKTAKETLSWVKDVAAREGSFELATLVSVGISDLTANLGIAIELAELRHVLGQRNAGSEK